MHRLLIGLALVLSWGCSGLSAAPRPAPDAIVQPVARAVSARTSIECAELSERVARLRALSGTATRSSVLGRGDDERRLEASEARQRRLDCPAAHTGI